MNSAHTTLRPITTTVATTLIRLQGIAGTPLKAINSRYTQFFLSVPPIYIKWGWGVGDGRDNKLFRTLWEA